MSARPLPTFSASREAQAAHWAARTLSGNMKPREPEEHEAWLAADPLNREAFDAVMAAHDLAQDAASMSEIQAIRREALAATPQSSSQRWRWAMAACALIVVGLISVIAFQSLPSPPGANAPNQIAANQPRDHYRTGIGERLTATLEDGSVMTLNTASEVRVRFADNQRRIELVSGQALFAVAHDASRPFLVEAGDQSVRATGTQFEVRRRGANLEVVLVEGTVAVGDTQALRRGDLSRAQRMQAGERLVSSTPAAFEVAPANIEAATSWTSGRIIFSSTRLDAAIEEINRYREHPIVIDDPNVAALQISGAYRIADASSFGRALSPTLPIREEQLPDGKTRLILEEDAQTPHDDRR